MSTAFFQGPAIHKKNRVLKIASVLFILILIIAAFSVPAHAAAIPIYVELNQFSSANVGGDNSTALLWKKGNADTTSSGVLRIVPNTGNQKGVVVRRNKITLNGGFSTYFVMNMNNSTSSSQADGLAFVIQSNSTPLIGNWGAGLGYQSVPNSLAVEFDIWQNTGWDIATSTGQYYYDPNNNHVAIVKNGDNTHASANQDAIDDGKLDTGTTVTTGAGTVLTRRNPGTLSLYKKDGTLDVNVWIDYDGTTLTATYGTSTIKNSNSNRVISRNIGGYLNSQDVYVGFSGSTGACNANIDIKKWCFTDYYDPDPVVPPTQGANSVGITLIPGSVNPTTANFRVKDIDNNDMLNQDVAVYLDGSTTSIATVNTGADGAQATYSIGTLSEGSHTIKGVAASGGASDSATFVVGSPTISPTTATFDKNSANTSAGHYADVAVSTNMSLYSATLSSITNGSATLTAGSDYSVNGDAVTIKKEYLATQNVGTTNLTFTFSDGSTKALAVTVIDSTPPTISPTTAAFDKNSANTSAGHYADVTTTMALYSATLSSITNGSATLTAGSDYSVSGNTVTIKKAYLATQSVGTTPLTFTFSDGTTRTLTVTVIDSTPPTISPATATFDKNSANTSAGHYADVATTMTLYSATLSSITNGSATLTAGSDYSVSGNVVTIKKEYLAKQSIGTTNLTFTFSDGSTKTLTVTVIDSTPPTISPATATFDKNSASTNYGDKTVNMTLYSASLSSIKNGDTTLTAGSDYTVSGNVVTIKKEYLAKQSIGTTTLTFTFSDGSTKTLTVAVIDSTPPTISPATATFDKNSASTNYGDKTVNMTLYSASLSSIQNGSVTLTAGSDYSVSGSVVTIKKEYLAKQSIGTTTLTFTFSDGSTKTLTVTVIDSTPPTISPATATFDKNSASTNYGDKTVNMTLYSASLSSIKNGDTTLTVGSDYSVSGNVVTIKKEYLAKQSVGTTTLTFTFSDGSTKTLTVTVIDSTPPTISPATATFDKNSASTNYGNKTVNMTLYSASLSSIKNGDTTLTAGSDYTVSGSVVTIKKEYLAKQSVGTTSLTFTFSDGSTKALAVTVIDSTPPTISPATATFDKNSANTSAGHYADVATTMTLYSAMLSSITNGSATLTAGSDYSVSGNVVTIKKEYLAKQSIGKTTLTFTFSDGSTKTLTVAVIDSTPPTISPATATFDKNSASTNYGDKTVNMTLYSASLSSIKNGDTTLTAGSDYSVSDSVVTIKKEYLAAQNVGTTNLTFTFSDGSTKTLTVTVIDSTPPTISPATATFDKNSASTDYGDKTVNMTLYSASLSSIKNGDTTLTAGSDYSVSGSVVTIKKEYLAKQNIGTTTLTFTFSDGSTKTLTVTVIDSTPPTISPTTATFDKNSASTDYGDKTVNMTLYSSSLSSIQNGSVTLTAGSDYTISGSVVMIKKEYLAKQSVGTTSLTFTFSDGSTKTLTVTVIDSTPPTISPATATFDKNSVNTNYSDKTVNMTLYSASLSSIKNGDATLTAGSDYTISGSVVTIKKEYLAKQSVGTTSLTFTFSDGSTKTLTVTVIDSTPPTISPTTATFDKNSASTDYGDKTVNMTLYSAGLSSIKNGDATLTAGSDYTISGSVVTIKKEYLAAQSVGTTTLTFTFSDGTTKTLVVTVTDSTPPTISPTTATFDKNSANTSVGHYEDVATTMTLYSATLSSIQNGSVTLTVGNDYSVSGNLVTIKKEYLAFQSVGTTTMTFTFSDGTTRTLTVTVIDSTLPMINPTAVTFDKNSASTNYSDKTVNMTLYSASLSSIKNGDTTLIDGSDYTVSDSIVTIKKEYLAAQSIGTTTLTFTFSDGSTKTLTVTVIDSTPTKLISNLNITTQAGAHRITILPNVPIQAIVGFNLSREATYLTMDFSKSNVKVDLSNLYCYCDNADGHTQINFSVDSTDPKKILLHAIDSSGQQTTFPGGTYTFNALITKVDQNLIIESNVTAQDASYPSFIDSIDAESSLSLNITVGTAPQLH